MDSAKKAVESVTEGVKKVAIGEGKPAKQGKKDKKDKKPAGPSGDAGGDSRPLELNPRPSFIQDRIDLFDRLKKKYDEDIAKKPREPITITLPDKSIKQGTAWETSPADIAKGISNSLYKRVVVARLDGDPEQLWDLERPLERSCRLELLDFSDPQGKFVYWHSSAHILGEAAELRWGCSLCIGPPVERGFYYEMSLPNDEAVQTSDWKPLETVVSKAIKEKQRFERLVLSKADLLEMFKYNKYKQHIISDKIADGTFTTVYRNGPLIDLCRGPHVVDTGRIEAFAIEKSSSSYFLGNKDNDSLQRIYGISFPSKKEMAEHKKFLEEAAKRDHRKLGTQQELFFFHELSPGSALWLPHGARIVNKLTEFLKEQYWIRNYEEVITPNIYNAELWKQSGHWAHYKDDMFVIPGHDENETFGLKPMNCPGHCLIFGHRERNYKELPWRVADFGVLHRNEASGALSGLTRVRRFQQDDAHIFAREDQIKAEVVGLFDFLKAVYGVCGLAFKLKLSTRPDKYMGELEVWNRAEQHLKEALDEFTATDARAPWELNEGDGAFYGPKIDVVVTDSLAREWQTATIQLDFQLPLNFGLQYQTADVAEAAAQEKAATAAAVATQKEPAEPADAAAADEVTKKEKAARKLPPGYARPVMIHRAMAGSLERFTGILTEHFGGKWPLWLSPRQVLVVPVGRGFYDYALEVQRVFRAALMYCDVDLSGATLQKKVRTGQLAQYNFIMVVGNEEKEHKQVNVRNRDDPATQDRGQPLALDVAVEKLRKLRDDRGTYNPFPAPAKAEKATA